MPSKRPFSVTLLLWMVLSLIAWSLLRLSTSLRWWEVLREFGSGLSPLYLFVTGAGWGAAGSVLLFGLFSTKPWARPAIAASTLLWLLEYWLERVFFQMSRSNLLFTIIINLICIAVMVFAVTHPGTKNFFTKSEEHEQPVKTPNSE